MRRNNRRKSANKAARRKTGSSTTLPALRSGASLPAGLQTQVLLGSRALTVTVPYRSVIRAAKKANPKDVLTILGAIAAGYGTYRLLQRIFSTSR